MISMNANFIVPDGISFHFNSSINETTKQHNYCWRNTIDADTVDRNEERDKANKLRRQPSKIFY